MIFECGACRGSFSEPLITDGQSHCPLCGVVVAIVSRDVPETTRRAASDSPATAVNSPPVASLPTSTGRAADSGSEDVHSCPGCGARLSIADASCPSCGYASTGGRWLYQPSVAPTSRLQGAYLHFKWAGITLIVLALMGLGGILMFIPRRVREWNYDGLLPAMAAVLVSLVVGSGLLHASGDRKAAGASRKLLWMILTGLATASAMAIIAAVLIIAIFLYFFTICVSALQGTHP